MKYLAFAAISLLSIASLVSSCGKDDNGTHCQFVSPSFVLVDYAEQEMDTIIIRRFEKGNAFAKSIDTFMLSKAEITYKEVGDDTFKITSTKDPFVRFSEELYNNDWEIYVPATQTTSRITEVNAQFLTKTDPSEECRSFAKFMRLDGNKREYTTWFGDAYRFYVVNGN